MSALPRGIPFLAIALVSGCLVDVVTPEEQLREMEWVEYRVNATQTFTGSEGPSCPIVQVSVVGAPVRVGPLLEGQLARVGGESFALQPAGPAGGAILSRSVSSCPEDEILEVEFPEVDGFPPLERPFRLPLPTPLHADVLDWPEGEDLVLPIVLPREASSSVPGDTNWNLELRTATSSAAVLSFRDQGGGWREPQIVIPAAAREVLPATSELSVHLFVSWRRIEEVADGERRTRNWWRATSSFQWPVSR